jgi:tetratricopeptide (TPR) repeat protein
LFTRKELARHFELAGKYEMCFQVLENELVEAEQHSAFSYMKTILEHLINLPLNMSLLNTVKIKLSEVYYKLSDFNSAIKTIATLKETELSWKIFNEVKRVEAGSLIATGEFELGKTIINDLLNLIDNNDERNHLEVELAYANFEQKNYEEAEITCNKLLENPGLSAELKGRCYNLKGMRRIYEDNDLNSAIGLFNKALIYFKEADSPRRVAGMEVNIGNIFTLLSDYENAEKHWQNALEINRAVGNLEQEGLILLNLGIFYFMKGKSDQAIISYKKAQKIFLNIGSHVNLGLVLLNLGEVYLTVCDYQSSFDSLEEAQQLFTDKENFEELAEVLLMLGRLYFVIGFKGKLEEIVEKYKTNLQSNKLPAKYELNLKFLRILLDFTDGKRVDNAELKSVRDEYKNYDDKSSYSDICFLLIENLIFEGRFKEALTEINQKFLIDLSSQNSILEAEREYFLGIISQRYASDVIKTPLEHFEKAYHLVKDGNISEITWKILLAISEIYIERGNLTKAKSFTIYGRELIHFIADNIQSPHQRAAYLKKQERFHALQKFESFYPV